MKRGFTKGIKRKLLPFEQSAIPSSKMLGWMKQEHSVYDGKRGLHNEILELARYLKSTKEEQKIKQNIIKKVSSVAQSVWRGCQVRLYGSCAVGLDIYSSDIDLCVHNWTGEQKLHNMGETQKRKRVANQCRKLGKIAGQRCPWMNKLEVRAHAKVPIINFFDRHQGVEVD